MQESHRIELKSELTDDLEKEVVAFLNAREGGEIYIGVNNDGSVVGVEDADQLILQIHNRIKSRISPSIMGLYDIRPETIDGLDTVKITLASGPEKPYYITNKGMSVRGCYLRVGTAAEPMEQRMIDQLFASRTRNSLRQIRSNIQALTFEQLKIYYQESGLSLNEHFASSLEFLMEDGSYNYVAYLMSDNNSTSIKVAKYDGLDRVKLIESPEFGRCCLIKSAKQVLDFINLNNPRHVDMTSAERVESDGYNPIALREAILNAIVHNDYMNEVPPKFELFSDRIEITSAGALPQGLSQEEFFEGYSVPRNKEIMRIFRDVRLVEQLGSGVPRILQSYSRDSFRFTENFIRMTFMSAFTPFRIVAKDTPQDVLVEGLAESLVEGLVESLGDLELRLELSPDKNRSDLQTHFADFTVLWEKTFGLTSGKLRESFGKASGKSLPKEILTLELITLYPEITAAQIGDILGVSERSVQTYYKKLKEAAIIEREGGRKEGEWIIKELEK
jgi:ATP-dependent DNA helicase RecG